MARILLAEDDDSMRHFLIGALAAAGHITHDFSNGQEAYDFLEKDEPVDVLLTDVVMPGMDGIELAEKARQIRPHLKIMFMTGFSAVSIGKGENSGHTPTVMAKPFHLKDLVAQIETLLAAQD